MKRKTRPHVEILLPVYNEIENLPLVVKSLDAVAERLSDTAQLTYLFVDDGSSDGSTEWLRELHSRRTDVRLVELVRNSGHGAALKAGIDHFDADACAIMDADMQDAPEALVDMLDKWRGGEQTVVVERGERRERNRWAFRLFYFVFHKLARHLPPIDFGTHCLLDREVVERLRHFTERNRYLPGLVSLASGRISSVRRDRRARAHGTTRVGSWGLVNLALTACLSFSTIPVRLVAILGLVCSFGAVLSGCVIVGIKLLTDLAIPGWASIMTATAFGNGIQLFCLGLIGEYIARMYDEVRARPMYFIREVHERRGSAKSRATA